MAVFGADDIPALLAELGVDVVMGSLTVKGLLDREDRRVLEGEGSPAAMIGSSIVVAIQTDSLPGITAGSAITADGTPYVVSAALSIEDGGLTTLLLRKP